MLQSLQLARLTDNSIVDRDALVREVEKTRRTGWATSAGERVIGAAAVSVPVSGWGTVVSLSVLGPAARMSRKVLMKMLPDVQLAAREIEAALTEAATERRPQSRSVARVSRAS